MNEIALANFYRVLNNEDRFPKEHELAEAAIAAKDELNALRSSPQPAKEAGEVAAEVLPNHFVQPVPNHCDRILWKGRYYHLPLSAPTPSVDAEAIKVATKEIVEEFDLDPDLEGPYLLISAIIRKHIQHQPAEEKK